MKFKLGQKIINIIRAKHLQIEYENMRETVRYISSRIDFDEKIAERILKKHKCPYLTFKKDKKMLKEYLSSIDATKFPKANGVLRDLQIRLLDLAKIVVFDLEKQDIHPFMIGGTLLGAVRHGGYIPWDDDIDFDLTLDDYNKMWEYLKTKYLYLETGHFSRYFDFMVEMDKLIQQHPNEIIFAKKTTCISAYLGTSFEDCIVLDFFPRAFLAKGVTEEQYLEYRKSKQKEFLSLKDWNERFEFYRKEFNDNKIFDKDGDLLAKCWGSYGFINFYRTVAVPKEAMFPLKRVKYEDTEFYAPNNTDKFLIKTFGKNYMKIPTNLNLFWHMRKFDKFLRNFGRQYNIQMDDLIRKTEEKINE